MSTEGQGFFFSIYFPVFLCFVLYKANISGQRLQDHWTSGNWILCIFAGNERMHKSLDEFEIRPDATTCFHGNREGYNVKNGIISFARTF